MIKTKPDHRQSALRRKNRAVALALVGAVVLFYIVYIVRAGVI